MDLFFVLSGYLITSILLRHQQSPQFLGAFYARRGLRIWPIYYLTLLTLVGMNRFLPHPYPLDALPYYLTYTQNFPSYWGKPMPPFNPAFDHTWTLALEEQYYLLWPALIAIAGRRRVVGLCLTLIAVSFIARSGFELYFVLPIRFNALSERLLPARCDGFALGGLLAALFRQTQHAAAAKRRTLIVWAAFIISASVLGTQFVRHGPGALGLPTPSDPALTILLVDLFYFGVVGLVLAYHGRPWLAPLRLRALAAPGVISYGIYVYHYPIYWAIDGFGSGSDPFVYQQSWIIRGCKLVVTLLVAAASWQLLEKPLLGLKRIFPYEKPPQEPSAA